MKGNEFIRPVQQYGREHGISVVWHPEMGKGSHGILIVGSRRTTVRNPKEELKGGTLNAMLNQIGLKRHDI